MIYTFLKDIYIFERYMYQLLYTENSEKWVHDIVPTTYILSKQAIKFGGIHAFWGVMAQ